jgi:signal transduction histidine kinase
MRFKSIFARIIFLHVIVVIIVSIFMPLALYWLLNQETKDVHDLAMREQANAIARHLSLRADGRWTLDVPASLHDIYSKAYGRYAYSISDEVGNVLFSSLDEPTLIFPSDSHPTDLVFLETRRGEDTISGVSLPKEIDGRKVWIQVAENLAHRDVLTDDIVADFFKRVGWITLPTLLLLLAIDIAIFRRALRPLLRASEQAQEISPMRTDVRLSVETIPNEIRPLVLAVNQGLERLERGFRVQREFTADAAHELRTPLAILRTRLDTLADQRGADELRQDIEGMGRVVGQLLDIAELETLVVEPDERADLRSVCANVAEFIGPLALAKGKNIALEGADGPVWVRGNSDMLHRAVRNLAENAIFHTAEGTTVELVVGQDGTVGVMDRGPGIPDSEREFLFRRFWRGDRRRAGSAGLGLSIVQRIADAHGASISVNNRTTGGAIFLLTFPALPS